MTNAPITREERDNEIAWAGEILAGTFADVKDPTDYRGVAFSLVKYEAALTAAEEENARLREVLKLRAVLINGNAEAAFQEVAPATGRNEGMKTPIEIMARGMLAATIECYSTVDDFADELGHRPERSLSMLSDAGIVALEAAGYRLLSAEGVTEEMLRAGIIAFTSTKSDGKELTAAIAASLRAAPKWSKGSEG